MRWVDRVIRGFRRRDVAREVEAEVAYHLERTVSDLVAAGWEEREARVEAERRFGDVARYRRDLARAGRRAQVRRRGAHGIAELLDDGRHVVRRLRRAPGFTAAVVGTFVLGIGANATTYGILDRLLLSPPPGIDEPSKLRRLMVEQSVSWMPAPYTAETVAYADYRELEKARSFAAVAAYGELPVVAGTGLDAERLDGLLVSGSYFGTLRVRAAAGRLIDATDDVPGGEPVVVISHGLWRRRYGGAPDVVGRTLDLGDYRATIIGVAPRGFTGVDLRRVDVWQALGPAAERVFASDDWRTSRGWSMFGLVARLTPGTSPGVAAAEATALYRRAREASSSPQADARVLAAPLIRARGPNAPPEAAVARWLGGVSFLLLVIVCANTANLMLARALRQQGEAAVRLALGIGWGRLIRQVVLESSALALLGGTAALGVAVLAGRWLRRVLLPDIAWTDPGAPGRVVAFTVAAALVAGLVTAIVPAARSARWQILDALKSGGRGATAGRSRLRHGLIAAQAALSVVLLVGAGLFVRSLDRVRDLDLGLDPDGVLVIEPTLDPALTVDERSAFFRRAEATLERYPGVERAAFGFTAPFLGRFIGYSLRIPGVDSIPRLATGGPTLNGVDADFLAVLGQRLVDGRGITPQDTRTGAAPVALVNETMARRIDWPDGNAIGSCMRLGNSAELACVTVVGVVGDARRGGVLEDETMQYYVAMGTGHFPMQPQALLVRSGMELDALIEPLRRRLHEGEPALRFARIRPMTELLAPDLRSWRLGATLFTCFGVLALIVAAFGLYTVLAFEVAQRRRELGIRAALGADARRLVRMVLRRALAVTAAGVAAGLALAVLAAGRIAHMLFETPPRDPVVLAVVAAGMLAVAVLAGALPAARATRTDPLTVLRAE